MLALEVLVITKGHPFDQAAFLAMFDALAGVACTHVEQPGAHDWLRPEHAGRFDAIVFYDMPGVGLRAGGPPQPESPPSELVAGFLGLLDAGQGIVFLHHAIAAWPAWDAYADIVGGRFHYAPARLRGRDWPDSGYRLDVTHEIDVVALDHPVCAGLPPTFTVRDELYLAPVFEDDVVPLLRSRAEFTDEHFFSAARAVAGQLDDRTGWHHPPGSDLVAWAKTARRSPIVYLQPGDGPGAYGDANYRRLLSNAIEWVASPAAHSWASAGA